MDLFYVKARNIYYIRALLGLPATIVHELAHWLVAFILFSRMDRFSIMPRFEGKDIIYGQVIYAPKLKVFCIPISLAPILINPAVAWLIYTIQINSILLELIRWYLIIIILFGSVPSTTDFKMAIRGLFTFSGFVFLCVCSFMCFTDNAVTQYLVNLMIYLKGVIMYLAYEIAYLLGMWK